MYRTTAKILDRTIIITASRDRCSTIRHRITEPLNVCSSTHDPKTGCTMSVLFGVSWSWEEFPPELKAQYDAELAAYAAALPAEITSRTDLKTLPSIAWTKKYIPEEKALAAMRKARKSPEERQAEADEAARRKREAEEYQAKRDAEKEAARRGADELRAKYPFLVSEPEARHDQVLCAKNIKTLLSRIWPGVKFSVRSDSFSMGDSVDIRWTDGPTVEQVEAYTGGFNSGHFDSMQDMYEYSESPWHIFGSSKYVHAHREISEALTETVLPAVQAAVALCDGSEAFGAVEGTEFSVQKHHDGSYQVNGSDKLRRGYHLHYGDVARLIAADIVGLAGMPESDPNTTGSAESRIAAPASTPEPVEMRQATIRRNEEKNGLEVIFKEKPAESILTFLKSKGFRWSKFAKLWYAKYSEGLMREVSAQVA